MAGPWFTVQESGDDWREISKIWISNGQADCKGRIEMKLRLKAEPARREPVAADDVRPIIADASGHHDLGGRR